MTKVELEVKKLKGMTEWALNKPTMKELRQQKSSRAKIGKILDATTSAVESFDSLDFVNDHKWVQKFVMYFFPEAVEEVVVEVVEEPQQPHSITTNGNVVHVNFNK